MALSLNANQMNISLSFSLGEADPCDALNNQRICKDWILLTFFIIFLSFSLQKRGVLERLDAGEVVVGDGGFLFCLEKRDYVKAGQWTPEVIVEHPEAGL